MSHTPPPWAVDTYSDGFDPDGDKDMNGNDYGRGDPKLLRWICLPIPFLASLALLTVSASRMPLPTYFGAVLDISLVAIPVLGFMGTITIGSYDYPGRRRVKHIGIVLVGIALYVSVAVWFMATHHVAI